MEDFGAHTNYCELALRELGYRDVFPHCGANAEINIRGHHVYPLVTGTFGAVDFLHSVLGEATDHFTQTEVEEMDLALGGAQKAQQSGSSGDGQRGLFGSGSSGTDFAGLLSQIPGMGGGLASTARDLQAQSAAQEYQNSNQHTRADGNNFNAPPGSRRKIYPILEFRDKVVRAINNTIAKIPGLESLVEKISETLTVFILSLLAPFVRPIIDAVSDSLKKGSSTVVEASANSQFEPWNDPNCTDPTHSMLSKDHFSNVRILYAWQNPGVPIDEVMNDILRTFHHPALRDEHVEIHKKMFDTVKTWMHEQPNAQALNHLLNSESQQQQQPYNQQYGAPPPNNYEQHPPSGDYWNQGPPPPGQWGQQGPPPPGPWGQGPSQNHYPPSKDIRAKNIHPNNLLNGGQGGYQYPPSGGGYGGY
ncbi:hypothetical protein DID88_008370 [Monilinia fructigena]|uniref:Uncharacterized protein n=1 Tax=Monilinia fructigena TaxID=38457 RepID=A0A395J654_9HELO|nr:hypothetical protein DID88_008370 [Monilinia fructigena]